MKNKESEEYQCHAKLLRDWDAIPLYSHESENVQCSFWMAFATDSLEVSERSKPVTKSLNSFKCASDNGRVMWTPFSGNFNINILCTAK